MRGAFCPAARITAVILGVTLMTGCRQASAVIAPDAIPSGAPTQTSPLPTPLPWPAVATGAASASAFPPAWDLEPITSDNVQRLSLLAHFAEGGLGDELALSADGRLLAVAAEGGAVLYDALTGAWLDFYPTSSNVTALAFSPDSHTLAYFYRVPSGEKYSLDDPDLPGQEILKPHLTLRSVPSGKVLYSQPTYGRGCGEYNAWDLTFSPDGQRIFFHDYFGRPGLRLGSLCVLDAQDGGLLSAIHPESPWRVHGFTPLLPDGKTVWVAVVDDSRAEAAGIVLYQLRRYNLENGALEAQLDLPGSMSALRLSPDRQWTMGGTPAQIRSAADGSLAAEIQATESENVFSAVRFSPDGATLALAAWDGSVGLYSSPQGQWLGRLEPVIITTTLVHNEPLHVVDLGFSADGGILYVFLNSYFVNMPEVIRAVRLADGQELFRLSGRNTVDRRPSLSPDGALLAWGGYEDGHAQVWSTAGGEMRYVLKGHTQTILQTRFSPDGRQLATASLDGMVRLWNGTDGAPLAALEAHSGGVWAIGYATDGRRLASIGMDGLLKLWNPADGSLLKTLESSTRERQVNSIHFTDDDRAVLVVSGCNSLSCRAGGAGGLESIDLESGQVTPLLTTGIQDLSLSADQTTFGVYGANGAQLGRGSSGPYKEQQRFISPYGNGGLAGAAVSLDGSLFVSGNLYGIHAWDTNSGQMIALAQDPSRAGNYGSMQFSADGRLLLVAGDDGVIYLWGVPVGS